MNAAARTIIAVSGPDAVAHTAAARMLARMDANDGRIAICLTGGSTPKQLYELLASEPLRRRVPWRRVHWFIGDDRFVASDDSLSNMGMARAAFLKSCAPPETIHAIPTDAATPQEAAARYERTLQTFYGADRLDPARPLFDMVLLGAGPDGHTASLFPGAPALNETTRWVVGVDEAGLAPFVPRVTLTLPALASSRDMLFLVSGPGKRAMMTRILAGDDVPAARARSLGETVWIADRAALPETYYGE